MRITRNVAFLCVLPLAACGGDGGSGPAPIAATPPVVQPAPTPPPAPTPTNYDTAEYERSNAAVSAKALAAYDKGASGAGVTIAFIDSGIDQTTNEFAGRISPASRDLVADRGIQDPDGHGTSIATVAAAARDGSFVEGIAPQATLLVLRAEKEGSCTPDCSFYDSVIARGVDAAVAGGARVINLSLGGTDQPPALTAAVARATAKGVFVVISAGNEMLADPDAFAQLALDPSVANGSVLIAGAIDGNRQLADFTNKAGIAKYIYLTALGVDVLALGTKGEKFYYGGTSYSAPAVAGAAALLAGAFPNLTGKQIASLLLSSADGAGAPGVDDQFGHGILNIARAFEPQGTTTIAGTPIAVSSGVNGATGGAMGTGEGFRAALADAVILDSYGRAFHRDLGRTLARAPQSGLAGAILGQGGSAVLGTGAHRLSFNFAAGEGAQPWLGFGQRGLDARGPDGNARSALVTTTLWRGAGLGLAVGVPLATLTDSASATAFFAAPGDGLARGGGTRTASAINLEQRVGGWTLAAGAGDAREERPVRGLAGVTTRDWRIGVAHRVGSATLGASLGGRHETGGLLGATLGPGFGVAGADTRTFELTARAPLRHGWRADAVMRHGWTDASAAPGLLTGIAGVRSFGWRIDLARDGLFTDQDRFALRFAQPMRVVDGAALLAVPTGYDYGTRSAIVTARAASLVPGGTERDAEAVYGRAFGWGRVDTHLFVRADADQVLGAGDAGAALSLSARF